MFQRFPGFALLIASTLVLSVPLVATPQEAKPASPPPPPYASALKDAKNYTGLLSVWQKGSNLLIEMGRPNTTTNTSS